jgi:hypothetical protein
LFPQTFSRTFVFDLPFFLRHFFWQFVLRVFSNLSDDFPPEVLVAEELASSKTRWQEQLDCPEKEGVSN